MIRIYLFLIILLSFSLPAYSELGETGKPSECIVIYGDSRTHHDLHRQVVAAFMQFNPKVVIHTGDLVHHGDDPEEWEIFNQITQSVRENSEFLPARGNHDDNIDLYTNNFDLPNNELWYSVDRNDIHFIFLDSNCDLSDTSEQFKWLEEDLVQKKARFTSVVFHYPLFTTGHHSEDEKGVREVLLPLFKKYDVDITFTGHNHQYERSLYDGIYHIVTGGGGAPLYDKERESPYSQVSLSKLHFCTLEVIEEGLIFKVWDVNLEMIDSVTVIK
jgi:predicted phosphodiesterase